MASGTAVSSFHVPTNREDLIDVVTNISPSETPFLSSLGKVKATAAYHEWSTDSLAAATANAHIEGQDYSFAVRTTPSRNGNYAQTFRNFAEVTDLERELNPAGIDDMYAYQMAKAMKEQARDMEKALIGTGTGASGASGTARELKGALAWIATNTATGALSGTGTDSPEYIFNTNLQNIWNEGGDPKVTYVDGSGKRLISGFTASSVKNVMASDKELVNAVDIYQSDFGTVKIVADRFMIANKIFTVTPDLWKLAVVVPTRKIEAAKVASTTRGVVETVATLECRQEKGNGLVTTS